MMIFSFRLRLLNIFQRFARHDHKAVLDKYFIKRISLQLKDLCGLFMKKFWRAFANIRPVPVLLKYKKVPVLLKSTSTCHFQWVPVWSQCLRSSTLRHICRQSGRGTNQYPSLMRALVKLVSWGKLLMVRLTLTQGISETMCLLFNFETNSTPISSIYVMFFTSILKTLDCKSSKSLSYDLFSKLNCSLKIDLFSQNCFVFW